MIDVLRHLQGQLVDRRFPLIRYLGGTDHSSVFLTEYTEVRTQKAAIKLVEALPGHAEEQLIRWRLAAKFAHPNLLRILHMDRCKLDGAAMLYVVTEYAEENLADTLLERPLSPAEMHDLAGTILEVLEYIHSKGFVHGHIQPSNIMAIGDRVKLSSDGICRIDEFIERRNGRTRYAAPESATGALSTTSDVWSLGAMMVECLGVNLAKLGEPGRETITVPVDLPEPFLEMTRHCLVPEPRRRWDVSQLKARLQRKATTEPAAAAPIRPQPARVPQEAPPVRSKPKPVAAEVRPHRTMPALKKHYALALVAGSLALAVILFGMAFSRRSSSASGPATKATASSVELPKTTTATRPVSPDVKPAHSREGAAAKAPRAAATAPAEMHSVASGEIIRGDVVHRVMPNVPRDASDTIWGTVRVRVRVNVDPSGSVVGAKFDSAGPSRYFARLSMAAAREWKFRPPSVDGKSVPSEWVIHFDYTKAASRATPLEQNPQSGNPE